MNEMSRSEKYLPGKLAPELPVFENVMCYEVCVDTKLVAADSIWSRMLVMAASRKSFEYPFLIRRSRNNFVAFLMLFPI
jgi:hypothetical protein